MKRREREFWCNIYETNNSRHLGSWWSCSVHIFIREWLQGRFNESNFSSKVRLCFFFRLLTLASTRSSRSGLGLALASVEISEPFLQRCHIIIETTERNIWAQSTSSDPRLVQCELLHRGKQTLTPLSSSNHAVLWSALLWQIHKSSNIETW